MKQRRERESKNLYLIRKEEVTEEAIVTPSKVVPPRTEGKSLSNEILFFFNKRVIGNLK